MSINAFIPYVNLVVGFMIPFMKRYWDSKFTMDKYTTRATSMN